MKSKHLRGSPRGVPVVKLTALAFVALGVLGLHRGFAGERPRLPADFSGLINDYTPPAPTVAGGPYEMHGKWSLHLSERDPAVFTAELSMETADFANTDPNHDPTKLGPHTHHIKVTDGVVHDEPSDPINWKTQCPVFKPPVTGGFVVIGTAYVTGNGGAPPFGNPSSVTICILGGTPSASVTGPQASVEFSNLTLAFGAEHAGTHFGTQAINGVVAKCDRPWSHEANDCRVAVID